MRHFGLADCFSFVLSCTRYGGKNRPDIFLEAARRFDLQPEEILLVEDSLYSVRTAHQAGFAPPEWRTPRQKQSVLPWSRPVIISSKPWRTSMCR